MKINSTILIVFIIALVALFYIWTATATKQKQDDILKKFKEIDSSLASGDDSVTIYKETDTSEINFKPF